MTPRAHEHSTRIPLHATIALLVAIIVAVLTPTRLDAGGFSALSIGFKRGAMAASVANPDDPSAIYHNPAGLINLEGTQLNFYSNLITMDIDLKLYDSAMQLHPADHDITPDSFFAAAPFLGMSTDFGTDELALGVAAYVPNAFGAFLPEDEPSRYSIIAGYMIAGYTTVALAYRVSDKVTIGVGPSLIYVTLYGERAMNLSVNDNPDLRFTDPDIADSDMRLAMDTDAFAYGYTLGILLEPTDQLKIGFSYMSSVGFDLTGDVDVTVITGDTVTTSITYPMVIPFTLRAGISYMPNDAWEVALDATYWHYQILQTQIMTLDPAPIPGFEKLETPKNYVNSFNVGLGIRHRLIPSLDIMLGVQLDSSPIPSSTLTLENPTQDYLGVTAGARWQITEDFRAGFAFMKIWLDLVQATDSILVPPVNAKGHGETYNFMFEVNYVL